MRPLPPIAGRLLAVLILVGALALVYLGAVQPLIDDYQATRDQIEDMQAAKERFQRVAAEVPARRAQLAALRQRQAASEGFLQGTNEGTGPVGSATGSLNGNAQALVQNALNTLGSAFGL